jgi:predicted amidophosphoribosyltransferase
MGGKIIRSFKYGRRFDALPLISEVMNRALHQFWEEHFDLIFPVPQSWRKTLARGFHPVEMISRRMGFLSHIPVHTHLLKRRWVWTEKDQAGLNRTERLANLPNAFYAVDRKQWKATKNILLVDDVFTTGVTIFRCKSALIKKYQDWNIKTLVFAHG